jgi:hypothetical protein
MEGYLLKKNKYWMKQERLFRLYIDGTIKYFKKTEQKGTMILKPGQRAIKDGTKNISIPTDKKDYILIQLSDLSK